jgi:hypothetical protein
MKKLLKELGSNSSSRSIKKYRKKLLRPTMEKSLNNGTTKSLLFGSKRFKKLTTNWKN